MTKIAKQLTELVGNTPLLELGKFSAGKGIQKPIIAKVEYFNPGGSHVYAYRIAIRNYFINCHESAVV